MNKNDEVYFHEDDYCQQEILPAAALDFCRSEIVEIDEFASEHRAPDGAGWTEAFLRDDSPAKLSDLGITAEQFRAIIREHLPEIPVVYTGYGEYRERCEQTSGFGFHADCIIYADWDEAGIVEHIWTGIFTTDETELAAVISAVQSLGKQFPLLYVDWAWSFVTLIDQSGDLQGKLDSKMTELARRMEE